MNGSADSGTRLRRVAQHLARHQLGPAETICAEILRNDPRCGAAWYFLSEIDFMRGRYQAAAGHIERALALTPGEAGYLVQSGKCQLLLGRRSAALAAADRAAALNPRGALVLAGLGALYSHLYEQDRALEYFARAAALEPRNIDYLFNLATAQRMVGELDAAEQSCDRIVELDPSSCRTHYLRADLRRQTPEKNHISEMESLLKQGNHNWRDEVSLCFALAKECEDIESYASSFEYLKRACDLRRRHMQYRVEDDISVIDCIIGTHTSESLSGGKPGFRTEEPVFIVGLPRTGTTLVERILSSHSRVFAAGELGNFATELARMVAESDGSRAASPHALIARSVSIDRAALGRAYLESTRPQTGHTARFIDKMPLNFLNCGLICAALPDARIIALDRDPMDACYAMYKTLFTSSYLFSFDLEELGRYFLAWRRLMDHWRAVLGPAMLTVSYEALVADPEAVSRRIVEFCGLDWERTCLDFHAQTGATTTASAVQVRRPIYNTSVGNWRHYRTQLQPLAQLLEQGGIRIERG
jgi:tetratricopeptide (TPR) repeat protein